MVELVERDPHLTREREQGRAQQAKGDHKQNADKLLVPDSHKALANASTTSNGLYRYRCRSKDKSHRS